jgi:hypothetical protein
MIGGLWWIAHILGYQSIRTVAQEDGMNLVDYKGSFLEVCFDAPNDLSLRERELRQLRP